MGEDAYEQARAERPIKALDASARALGYKLVPITATSVVPAPAGRTQVGSGQSLTRHSAPDGPSITTIPF